MIDSLALDEKIESTYFTSKPTALDKTTACCSNVVKSSLPGRLW